MGNADERLDEETKRGVDLLIAGSRLAGNDAVIRSAGFLYGKAAEKYARSKLSPNT